MVVVVVVDILLRSDGNYFQMVGKYTMTENISRKKGRGRLISLILKCAQDHAAHHVITPQKLPKYRLPSKANS